MAYDPNPSARERLILDGLSKCGITWVTVSQLRAWFRKGLPRALDQVAYFAWLIDRLGPRHTDHALLVVAGAWPEQANQAKVSKAFSAWFELQFGAIADDPGNCWDRLYFRMSRAGGVRRRALEIPRLEASVVAHDLRATGYPVDEDLRLWSVDPNERVRFHTREYVRRWAAQLPGTRATLMQSGDDDKLNALRNGHMWASASGRPEDTPLQALDVLLGQAGGRPLTNKEVGALLAGSRVARVAIRA